MSQPDDRPLVTFFVIAYNQERFVRAAVESAFAQTYPNLEIILSDDASPDGTFRVMEEMAAAYRGPHRVRLNRNPENLGVVGHINRVVSLSSGELLVQNAGDDISDPERADRLVAAWQAAGQEPLTLYSAATIVDSTGRRVGRRGHNPKLSSGPTPAEVLEGGLITLGATCAWSHRMFEIFGPLSDTLLVEDLSTTFRSAKLGGIGYVDEELLRWRTGGLSWKPGRNLGQEALYGTLLTYTRWRAASYRSVLEDLETPIFEPEERRCLESICRSKLRILDHQIALAEASRWKRLSLAANSFVKMDPIENLKNSLKYNLDALYISYLNLRSRIYE